MAENQARQEAHKEAFHQEKVIFQKIDLLRWLDSSLKWST